MADEHKTQPSLPKTAEIMKRRDRRDAECRREKARWATRKDCGSPRFLRKSSVLKRRVRIAERRLCGPLRTLRFIVGKGIEDVRLRMIGAVRARETG